MEDAEQQTVSRHSAGTQAEASGPADSLALNQLAQPSPQQHNASAQTPYHAALHVPAAVSSTPGHAANLPSQPVQPAATQTDTASPAAHSVRAQPTRAQQAGAEQGRQSSIRQQPAAPAAAPQVQDAAVQQDASQAEQVAQAATGRLQVSMRTQAREGMHETSVQIRPQMSAAVMQAASSPQDAAAQTPALPRSPYSAPAAKGSISQTPAISVASQPRPDAGTQDAHHPAIHLMGESGSQTPSHAATQTPPARSVTAVQVSTAVGPLTAAVGQDAATQAVSMAPQDLQSAAAVQISAMHPQQQSPIPRQPEAVLRSTAVQTPSHTAAQTGGSMQDASSQHGASQAPTAQLHGLQVPAHAVAQQHRQSSAAQTSRQPQGPASSRIVQEEALQTGRLGMQMPAQAAAGMPIDSAVQADFYQQSLAMPIESQVGSSMWLPSACPGCCCYCWQVACVLKHR